MGSIKSFDSLAFLNDLYAKIAIGNSVHPNIIFLHFFLIKYFIERNAFGYSGCKKLTELKKDPQLIKYKHSKQ